MQNAARNARKFQVKSYKVKSNLLENFGLFTFNLKISVFWNFPFMVPRSRDISNARLNALRRFHLRPINVVISHDPITKRHLGVCFALRCFQRLSRPDIATQRCRGRDNWYTRGQFIPVLSSHISFITKGADYIFTRPAYAGLGDGMW